MFSYNDFNENRLILSCISQQNSFNKIYYIATIPYSKIYKQSFAVPVSIITLLIFSICLVISLLFAFFSSKYLYEPVKIILKKFNISIKNNNSGDNEFKLISDKIQKLLEDKDDLDQKYKNILPIISENFIFNFLNSNLDITENDFNDFMDKNNIILNKKYFITSLIKFNYKDDFYKFFNHEKQLDIINQTKKLIINAFKNSFNIYVLTLTKTELCIILNFNENVIMNDIAENFNKILPIFEKEKKYMDISIGIGDIHQGLDGLKSSYNESCQAIATILPHDEKKIKIHDSSIIDKYSYTLNEENGLINYLLCGFEEESIKLINAIIKKNKKNNLSCSMEKELYLRIYYSCIRALSSKDISIKNLMGNEYIDVPKKINSLSNNNLNDYLLKIVRGISAISNYKGRFAIDEIIDYINQNFSKDFSIEYIADKYKISIPHLSRLLKKRLGISFQQYVNKCRIGKAKNLLLKTSKGLDEISLECGFNSRFTFLRMFKILEKITPSQYKMINKKKLKIYQNTY